MQKTASTVKNNAAAKLLLQNGRCISRLSETPRAGGYSLI